MTSAFIMIIMGMDRAHLLEMIGRDWPSTLVLMWHLPLCVRARYPSRRTKTMIPLPNQIHKAFIAQVVVIKWLLPCRSQLRSKDLEMTKGVNLKSIIRVYCDT